MTNYTSTVLAHHASNPEFSRPIPTNGYGNVEIRAQKSIAEAKGWFQPPHPLSMTTTTPVVAPSRKICRILSPMASPDRAVMLSRWRTNGDTSPTRGSHAQGRKVRSGVMSDDGAVIAASVARPNTADVSISYQRRRTGSSRGIDARAVSNVARGNSRGSSDVKAMLVREGFGNSRRPTTSHCLRKREPPPIAQTLKDRHGRAEIRGDEPVSDITDSGLVVAAPVRPSTSGGERMRNVGADCGSGSMPDQRGGHETLPRGTPDGVDTRRRRALSAGGNIGGALREGDLQRKGTRSGWSETKITPKFQR